MPRLDLDSPPPTAPNWPRGGFRLTAPERLYPSRFLAKADFLVAQGRVVKNRYGHANRPPTELEDAAVRAVSPAEAKSIVETKGW